MPADGAAGHSYPPELRVRRGADFDRAMRGGVRVADAAMAVWAVRNDLSHCRIGLTVSRRHGNAVARNRLKRIMRESFRLVQAELPPGLDLICRPHLGSQLELATTMQSLMRLANRAERVILNTLPRDE